MKRKYINMMMQKKKENNCLAKTNSLTTLVKGEYIEVIKKDETKVKIRQSNQSCRQQRACAMRSQSENERRVKKN